MIFQNKIYNVITKSKLVEVFSEKRVDRDVMTEYFNLLGDQNVFSRYIFDILYISCSNMKDPMKDFTAVKNEFGDFFREVIVVMQDISKINIDIDFYIELWLYMILCEGDNRVLSLEDRNKILTSLNMPRKLDRVELCFQVLFLGEYLEILLKEAPVNLDLIKETTSRLSILTQQYNRSLQ